MTDERYRDLLGLALTYLIANREDAIEACREGDEWEALTIETGGKTIPAPTEMELVQVTRRLVANQHMVLHVREAGDEVYCIGAVGSDHPDPHVAAAGLRGAWAMWRARVPEPESDSEFIDWLVEHGWHPASTPTNCIVND